MTRKLLTFICVATLAGCGGPIDEPCTEESSVPMTWSGSNAEPARDFLVGEWTGSLASGESFSLVVDSPTANPEHYTAPGGFCGEGDESVLFEAPALLMVADGAPIVMTLEVSGPPPYESGVVGAWELTSECDCDVELRSYRPFDPTQFSFELGIDLGAGSETTTLEPNCGDAAVQITSFAGADTVVAAAGATETVTEQRDRLVGDWAPSVGAGLEITFAEPASGVTHTTYPAAADVGRCPVTVSFTLPAIVTPEPAAATIALDLEVTYAARGQVWLGEGGTPSGCSVGTCDYSLSLDLGEPTTELFVTLTESDGEIEETLLKE